MSNHTILTVNLEPSVDISERVVAEQLESLRYVWWYGLLGWRRCIQGGRADRRKDVDNLPARVGAFRGTIVRLSVEGHTHGCAT